jgi:hypothetical protein
VIRSNTGPHRRPPSTHASTCGTWHEHRQYLLAPSYPSRHPPLIEAARGSAPKVPAISSAGTVGNALIGMSERIAAESVTRLAADARH